MILGRSDFASTAKRDILLWVMPFFGVVIFFHVKGYTCSSPAWSLKKLLRVIHAPVASESSTWAGHTEFLSSLMML
jgi:hypothetical protein